ISSVFKFVLLLIQASVAAAAIPGFTPGTLEMYWPINRSAAMRSWLHRGHYSLRHVHRPGALCH
ncbi:hypothetical protein, partial [Xylella fastidiosa]|uniref:hypothetical protein n=1 Tax=Xylella fastidiosa TaxID=2371 RepID=UPI001A7E72B9